MIPLSVSEIERGGYVGYDTGVWDLHIKTTTLLLEDSGRLLEYSGLKKTFTFSIILHQTLFSGILVLGHSLDVHYFPVSSSIIWVFFNSAHLHNAAHPHSVWWRLKV